MPPTDAVVELGATMVLRFEYLGNLVGRTALYLTVKQDRYAVDAAALLQIEETAGLTYLNGAPAVTPGWGDILVTDAINGFLTATLADNATVLLNDSEPWHFDLKLLYPVGLETRSRVLDRGQLYPVRTLTRVVV